MLEVLPFDRKSRERLKRIAELLKTAHNDAKLIERSTDAARMICVRTLINEVYDEIRAIEDQVDRYGIRREKEAAAIKRRLPAPKPVVTIVTPPPRPRQMMLLPGPEVQS